MGAGKVWIALPRYLVADGVWVEFPSPTTQAWILNPAQWENHSSVSKPQLSTDAGKELPVGKEGDLALKPQSVSSLMTGIWGNKEKYDSYFS